jgi:hypothetical protein
MAAMTGASDAYAAWRERAREVLECRRLQYNAVIERLNAANAAWSAQIDVYCARRDIRCRPIDREQVERPAQ